MATFRYLALGDSYSIGEGVTAVECWPGRLFQKLRRPEDRPATCRVLAKTGWTVEELLERVREVDDPPYQLITLLIGVNNQYRGLPLGELDGAIHAMLEQVTRLAAGLDRLLVASIPDWGVSPFAADRDRARISREIDAWNDRLRRLMQGRNIPWVDFTTVSRAARESRDFTPDGLHPGPEVHARWCAQALPAARQLMRRR